MAAFKAIPGIEKQILRLADERNYKNSEATAIARANGEILLLWSEFLDPRLLTPGERASDHNLRGPAGDDGYARISGMVSGDGGRTWSAPFVVVDDADALVNCISPAITRLADGRLMLAYSWRSGGNPTPGRPDVRNGAAARRVRFSDDDGRNWSAPTTITPDDGRYHTGCHDRAWTLPSGRVLVQCHSRFDQPGPPSSWRRMTTWLAFSDDNGASWQASTRLDEPRSPHGFAESCLAQRADGSLLMVLRTTLGYAFFTESFDEGATWSEPWPAMVAPAAPTYLARLPDSDELLLIWNPGFNPDVPGNGQRCPLLCALSGDGGRTWGLPKALESDPSYGWDAWAYPSVLFHKDYALLTYHRGRAEGERRYRDLMLARVPLDWFRS